MQKTPRSAIKNAIRKEIPQLDRETMTRERARFRRAEREKAKIRGQLDELREKRRGA